MGIWQRQCTGRKGHTKKMCAFFKFKYLLRHLLLRETR